MTITVASGASAPARPLRVLVACEFSGIVRDAFRSSGHDAMSCDILPTERTGPHYQGDVRDVLYEPWDLIVAHPPCTYLANSGVRWLHERPERWAQLDEAAEFFRLFLDAPAEFIAVENPVMHKYGVERVGRRHDQTVQPWQFGDGETKRTCFWLKNLPPLQPTQVVEARAARVWRMPPGPERQKERSRFFPGIAAAMADQWGRFVASQTVTL